MPVIPVSVAAQPDVRPGETSAQPRSRDEQDATSSPAASRAETPGPPRTRKVHPNPARCGKKPMLTAAGKPAAGGVELFQHVVASGCVSTLRTVVLPGQRRNTGIAEADAVLRRSRTSRAP